MKYKSNLFDTGDINFTAAAITMGFPLDDIKPCSLIMRDNGRNYARFHLMTVSIDGLYPIGLINSWWSNPESCNDRSYSAIMRLLKEGTKKKGLTTAQDWLDFTIDHLKDLGIFRHPQNMKSIPDFISKVGESEIESTLSAFCFNREEAYQTIAKCRRSIMLTYGRTSHARIDEALPAWKRNELIARLKN